ncbi:hypothetical protein L465_03651 [Enterobacter sp. BIDMC 29]|uniref:hypothetical protein n=1 Tax=Enterobacter sp. BIDMC 29 TaxID=1329841 RepID=UPI000449EF8C|nr:hypothetical protein [Enterobacter sp. BIDMC 29]EUM08119.1 hypothetical protein L465_03651 [Enterobacter sp. BIDMC 29]
MHLNLLRSCIFFLISLSGAGQAAGKDITTEEYVNSIYSATRQAWPVLENVWDTHVYRQLRLIVADDHNAWAIDSKSLTKLPYSEIQQRHLPVDYMHYQEIQWPDSRPTIYVSLGTTLPPEEKARFQSETKPVPALFNVATHEAFHFFVQANVWKKISPDNDSRATLYPVQGTPRFFRNSIIRSLYATLQGDQNGLGHARYWFDLWKKLYPDDANRIRQTDVDEGSARYVEIAAEIIAQGQRFNTAEFQHALINKMKDEINFIYTHSDSESYPIGALSGFILDMKKMKWQSSVVQGMPPLDILLGSIPPITQQADRKLEAEVNQEVNKISNKVGAAIDNFIKAYNYPRVIKIFVSSELSGSYSLSGGFFRTKTIPHDLMVGLSSSANWTGGSYSVKEVVAAAIDNSPDYRGKRGFLILYVGKLPPSEKGRLILKTGKLSLNIPYPDDIEKTHIVYLP